MKHHACTHGINDNMRMELQHIANNHHIHAYPKVKPDQECCGQFNVFDVY